jgi:hypothetical protein
MADENFGSGYGGSILAGQNTDLVQRLLDSDFMKRYLNASDPDKVMRDETGSIIAQMYAQDTQTGLNITGGGFVGNLVGTAAAGIMHIVDGIMVMTSAKEKFGEAFDTLQEIEQKFNDALDLRYQVETILAEFTSPLEQAARVRSKMAGMQATAQGLTGGARVAAQLAAEQQYRAQVGPALPQAIRLAGEQARADAMLKIKAIEAEYGIQLSENMAAQASAKLGTSPAGQAAGGVFDVVSGVGKSISGIEALAKRGVFGGKQESEPKDTNPPSQGTLDSAAPDQTGDFSGYV